jgi:anti-sigma regulatory factor (Ser/Thr protein kinase)
MKKAFKIKIAARPRNIELVSNFVKQTLEGSVIPKDVIDEILISVEEAVTNVVIHAYRNVPNGGLRLVLTLNEDRVEILLYDKGRTFNPREVPSPDLTANLSDRRIGGLGLFLMKKFMDEVNFRFKNTEGRKENELRMVKYLA